MMSNYKSKKVVKKSYDFDKFARAFAPLIDASKILNEKTTIFRNAEWQRRFAESIANSL